jgi:hypothetical protein
MRENCTYGSQGGEAKTFPTPISKRASASGLGTLCNTSLKGFLPRRRAALGGRAKRRHRENDVTCTQMPGEVG